MRRRAATGNSSSENEVDIEKIKKELIGKPNVNLGLAQFNHDKVLFGSVAEEAFKCGNVEKWCSLVAQIILDANDGDVDDKVKDEFSGWVKEWGISKELSQKMFSSNKSKIEDYDFLNNHPLTKQVKSNAYPNILMHGLIYCGKGKDGFKTKHFDYIYAVAKSINRPKEEVDRIIIALKAENDLLNQFSKLYIKN